MVTTTLRRIVSPCWRPSVQNEGQNSGRGGDLGCRVDGLWWYKDSGRHVHGEFSMAIIQANNVLEDYSQLESGPLSLEESGPQGTFVGIYDGHAGPEASQFISDHLFDNIKSTFSYTPCFIHNFVPSVIFCFHETNIVAYVLVLLWCFD